MINTKYFPNEEIREQNIPLLKVETIFDRNNVKVSIDIYNIKGIDSGEYLGNMTFSEDIGMLSMMQIFGSDTFSDRSSSSSSHRSMVSCL